MRTLLLTAPARIIAAFWLLGLLAPLPLHQLTHDWPMAVMIPFNLALLLTCTALMLNSLERLRMATGHPDTRTQRATG